MGATCPSANTENVEQESFWVGGEWDGHKVGWAIAGGCALLTVLISFISVTLHCRNYTNPREQKQIIRILYMPPVYAIISFFSYRFFRDYTYYSLIEVAYEAVTISAFFLLLVEIVAATSSEHRAEAAMERKDKRALPLPFCCLRYRPTKPYFMYSVKYAVLQYVIIRPLISVAGIVTQAYGVLCSTAGLSGGLSSLQFANIYLEAADFLSITIALYGLLLFYGLSKDELKGRQPLAKFLAIKGIVMATFYQSFIFDMLAGRVIHATTYWTETNIANGLNALAICIEMVFFALLMWWAYSPSEYKTPGAKKGSAWRALWDSVNFSDFAMEIYHSLAFFVTCGRRSPRPRPATGKDGKRNVDFGEAFGVAPSPFPSSSYGYARGGLGSSSVDLVGAEAGMGAGGRGMRKENIQLAPYHSDYSAAHPNLSRPSLALGRTQTAGSNASSGGGTRGMMDLFADRSQAA